MGITIAWYWVVVIIALAIFIPWVSSKAHDQNIEEIKEDKKPRFSRVDEDTVQELQNMVSFLKERDQVLVFHGMSMETKDKPLSCDYKAIEKGNHPVLLAFVRAAHLAGCTVTVREKGTAIQERVANKALSSFVSECTSSITRKSVEKKKEDDEMKEKKEKYGYYK